MCPKMLALPEISLTTAPSHNKCKIMIVTIGPPRSRRLYLPNEVHHCSHIPQSLCIPRTSPFPPVTAGPQGENGAKLLQLQKFKIAQI